MVGLAHSILQLALYLLQLLRFLTHFCNKIVHFYASLLLELGLNGVFLLWLFCVLVLLGLLEHINEFYLCLTHLLLDKFQFLHDAVMVR